MIALIIWCMVPLIDKKKHLFRKQIPQNFGLRIYDFYEYICHTYIYTMQSEWIFSTIYKTVETNVRIHSPTYQASQQKDKFIAKSCMKLWI